MKYSVPKPELWQKQRLALVVHTVRQVLKRARVEKCVLQLAGRSRNPRLISQNHKRKSSR